MWWTVSSLLLETVFCGQALPPTSQPMLKILCSLLPHLFPSLPIFWETSSNPRKGLRLSNTNITFSMGFLAFPSWFFILVSVFSWYFTHLYSLHVTSCLQGLHFAAWLVGFFFPTTVIMFLFRLLRCFCPKHFFPTASLHWRSNYVFKPKREKRAGNNNMTDINAT